MRKRKFSSLEKEFVSNRAKRKCEYCHHPFDFSHDAFHIEHIIPSTGTLWSTSINTSTTFLPKSAPPLPIGLNNLYLCAVFIPATILSHLIK